MSLKLKRRLTYGAILLFNLCTGLGYAIIFPTIWDYTHTQLGGGASMFGLIVSAYSISSFIANPLIGWWSDRILNTRRVLLVTILAEMFGNILYFVGMHTWVLVIGRLVSGVGAGGGAAVLADITRTTSEEERTPVLAVVIASRQLGLIIGPAFNIFLSQLDFKIMSLPVNRFTSPGLFMAALWLLLEIIVLCIYYNLTDLQEKEDVEKLFQNYNSIVTGSIPYSEMDNVSTLEVGFTSSYPPCSGNTGSIKQIVHSFSNPNLQVEWFENPNPTELSKEEIESIQCQINKPEPSRSRIQSIRRLRGFDNRATSISDKMIESAERVIQSTSGSYAQCIDEPDRPENDASKLSSTNQSTAYSSEPMSSMDETTGLIKTNQDYFRDEIIVLLGLAFISCFAQTVAETVLTPYTQKYYNFSELENSYVYLVAGIEAILVFMLIKYISRRVSDRIFLIFGFLFLIIAMCIPMIFLPTVIQGDKKTLYYFIIAMAIDLVGIAIIVVCSSSLLSKLTSSDSQALFQGLRRSMCSLGCIMGPLWGGAFLFHHYILFSVPAGLTAFVMVLFMNSFKTLRPSEPATQL